MLSGYASMAIVVIVLTALVARLFIPAGATPGSTYLAVNLGYSLAAAVLGGWVTARLAPGHLMAHGGALAGMILVLSLSMPSQATTAAGGPSQPAWYFWGTLVIGVTGALIGAWLRTRQNVR